MSLDFFSSDTELGVNTFASYLEQDALSQPNPILDLGLESAVDTEWLDHFLDDPILNDKMMSDALQPQPHVQSEHSYSLTNGVKRPISPVCEHDSKVIDFEQEFLTAVNPNMTVFHKTANKVQPSRNESPPAFEPMDLSATRVKEEPRVYTCTQSSTARLQQPTIILASQYSVQPTARIVQEDSLILPQINIKVEPVDAASISSSPEHATMFDRIGLPPTPPSSNSSDSEGGLSPHQSAPSSPQRQHSMTRQQAIRSVTQQLFTSPIPTSGVLMLTEEEKRTLISEGYPVPNKLPLSKQEEKNLKKIRRKIKNKISAQESRRKKKEYLETLEKKVESFNSENIDLKKKVDHLETNNRSLMSQLHKLQTLAGKLTRPSSPASQTGTCMMVLVVFFAVFLGAWSPTSLSTGYSSGHSSDVSMSKLSSMVCQSPSVDAIGPKIQEVTVDAYSTPNMRSRVLLSESIREGSEECEQYGPHPPFSYKDLLVSWLVEKPGVDPRKEELLMEPPHPLEPVADIQSSKDYTEVVPMEPITMHPGPSSVDNLTALVTTSSNAVNATS